MGQEKVRAPCSALIVEPNRQLSLAIRALLLELGTLDTTIAADSDAARKYLDTLHPDLIVCGFDLPPVGGPDFVRYVRRVTAELAETPIIMAIAHPDADRVGAARDAGVDEILAVPITGAALDKRWHAITHNRRPFVRAPGYTGPDRRRITAEWYDGPERRKGA